MLDVVIEEEGRESRTVRVTNFPCRIGRGKDVEVQLPGWRVARVHAELHRIGRGLKLVDLGTIIGTRVNGERIVEYGPLSERDEIVLGGYRLRVQGEGLRLPSPAPVHRAGAAQPQDEAGSAPGDRDAPEHAGTEGVPSGGGDGPACHEAVRGAASRDEAARDEAARGEAGREAMPATATVEGMTFPAGSHPHAGARPAGGGRADVEQCRPFRPIAVARLPSAPEGLTLAAGPARCAVETDFDGQQGSRVSWAEDARDGSTSAVGCTRSCHHDFGTDTRQQDEWQQHAQAAGEQARTLGWRRLIHQQLLEMIDLRRSNLTQFSTDELRAEVQSAVERIVADLKGLPADIDRVALVRDTVDEAVGLGPLERLMDDPLVSEIMVNSANDIFIERQGRLQQVPLAFSDDDAIRNVIERIVAPLGRRIDESSPLVDARLADGSRVNAIIPPVALKGPTITIRRFNRRVMTPDTLVENGSASPEMMAFLRVAVEQRRSLIVSGGTGSGKTTLLNVLSNLIPKGERLITIEDAAELKLMHPHLVSLESRPANAEGRGAITIRDLVRNALRMRPDRIIVGECRGAEALDMMQAMNTGHEGSMTTVHANTPRDVLSRVEMLMLMAGIELPLTALREQVASAVDLIIHQARFSDGSRRITSITEVCGVESGKIQTHEIFRYEQTGLKQNRVQGRFRANGEVPSFYEALRDRGVPVDFGIFEDPFAEVAGNARPG